MKDNLIKMAWSEEVRLVLSRPGQKWLFVKFSALALVGASLNNTYEDRAFARTRNAWNDAERKVNWVDHCKLWSPSSLPGRAGSLPKLAPSSTVSRNAEGA